MLALIMSAIARQRHRPLVVILGCTGTGKSDLAIGLARRYDGEVVNADSMQIYKGLDIATNKVTMAEMKGVPHHLIGHVEPSKVGYNVHAFRMAALQCFEEIWARGQLPLLVGGTAYYVEAAVYRDNLVWEESSPVFDDLDHFEDLNAMSNEQLHDELKRVDPQFASQVHPQNRSRVLKAIAIFRVKGIPKSELLKRQHNTSEGRPGSFLRFPNTLFLCLDAEKSVLDGRQETRIAKMLERGLREEIEQFYDQYGDQLSDRGVWQAIAVKEFLSWLRMPMEERRSEKGTIEFAKCCQLMKIRTRQYTRRQRIWIRNHLNMRVAHHTTPIVHLETSAGDMEAIVSEAATVLDQWLSGESDPKGPMAHFAGESDPSGPMAHFVGESDPSGPMAHFAGESDSKGPMAHFAGESDSKGPMAHFAGESDPKGPMAHFAIGPLGKERSNGKVSSVEYQQRANRISHCPVCQIDIQGTEQYEKHLKGKRHMAKKHNGQSKKTMNDQGEGEEKEGCVSVSA